MSKYSSFKVLARTADGWAEMPYDQIVIDSGDRHIAVLIEQPDGEIESANAAIITKVSVRNIPGSVRAIICPEVAFGIYAGDIVDDYQWVRNKQVWSTGCVFYESQTCSYRFQNIATGKVCDLNDPRDTGRHILTEGSKQEAKGDANRIR